jgi:hypothetical protein
MTRPTLAICCCCLALVVSSVRAAGRKPAAPGGGSVVRIPYTVNDNVGSQWMIYQGGWLRQQGNMPLYSQAAMLTVNGNQPQNNSNQARMDEKSGEIIFDETNAGGVMVTRRIFISKQGSYVRYIDVLRNPTQQDLPANVQINTNFNYGVQTSQSIEDPKKKDRQIAWVGQMQVGRAIVEMYGSKNAKSVPEISWQQGSNVVQATMQTTIPAGKQVAILHLHAVAPTSDQGAQLVTSMKSSQLLADVPLELRKVIINVSATQAIGEREVLRGELFDVIELRGGEDQIKGTIAEKSFQLQTFYGPVELPAERVVGLINVGQFRPRQLLVTVDGEVFGGTLSKETVAMQLSSGQTTQVPLSQISRIGYRKRAGEPEEWNFDRPMIALRSGERMNIAMPAEPLEVNTRYGLLKLKPESIASILFQSDEHGVHEIILTDGSRFAGLVAGEHFDMQLVGTSAGQKVSFPAATVARLQFTSKSPDDLTSDDAPTLALSNQDTLVGTLGGQLKLDTTFDTISIDATELRGLTRAPEAGLDVQVTLWDQTTISGQLEQPEVTCELKSGVSVKIPVPLIDRYSNPQPKPSPSMIERIKSVVAELSADDWKQRERAEATLVSMGPVVSGVLKEMSGSQPPEAQQRIDSVLKQLEKQQKSAASAGAGPAIPGQVVDQ